MEDRCRHERYRWDKIAGNRVVFLTGSREDGSGLTSEGAGIFDLSADGTKLFLNAVNYAAALPRGAEQPPLPPEPEPQPSDIAWVSFHPADNTPSGNATTAGFTRAPDVVYTDLLKTNGYAVTRFVTSGTPNVAQLSKYGLVIISRSVPSGDYQDPPETAAWHSITAPTMLLGGYALRASRLGFSTGETIPDTAGPVHLTVNDPAHPIFNGIGLDANKMMANPYVDVVSYNDVVQRGISVNADPIAEGGTVLATIGTDTDPAFGGTVIAEWPAGATMSNASADATAGKRLVFLTGSREDGSGLTSEAAGIYDLQADGAKMFLNAVRYILGAPQPKISSIVRNPNGSITISWAAAGVLQSSSTLAPASWSAVPAAQSPYTTTATGIAKFYRLTAP
jgi:hypothetical protein